jgi:hypothetical protein
MRRREHQQFPSFVRAFRNRRFPARADAKNAASDRLHQILDKFSIRDYDVRRLGGKHQSADLGDR